jgi:tetratricopeptide (TPR) repeat protein
LSVESTSAPVKGEAIAEALAMRRAFLFLDGLEPLQHGPGPQVGLLKDQGLRALLRRFAAAPPRAGHSLIVLTSRVTLADLQRFRDGAAPVIDIERLSDRAGAKLLQDNDVRGIDKELRAASRDFGGHPLALTLLASLLKETQNGDVRRRDHIRGLLADTDNPGHDHARRVMGSYEQDWLADQPVRLAILHCVGLFDRPANADCLAALRAKPGIPGLTDALVDLSDHQWHRAVARLREVRLLAPVDPSDPNALDAHPLVREWFGDRLKQTNEPAWKEAHSRLYDFLGKTAYEGKFPRVPDLAQLYHAIAHGCRAGRYREALNEIYKNRICRRHPNGDIEFYSSKILGVIASNLGAISWFFESPYKTPVAALTSLDREWVLGEASFGLRAQGRLQEALPAAGEALLMAEEIDDRRNAAIFASNISEAELFVGKTVEAVAMAKASVAHADRNGGWFEMMANRATQADALHAAGKWDEAESIFVEAERRQREWLYSLAGYRYCDLLLSRGRPVDARDRAVRALQIAQRDSRVLDIALSNLILGRAHFALGLLHLANESSLALAIDDGRAARVRLDEAIEWLAACGETVKLPRGLLARAAFRRAVGDWDGAKRDLNEAKEIAEPGLMRLYWCDCALEGARLALARREAFAPLNGRRAEPAAARFA